MSTLVKELIDSGIEVIDALNSNGYICRISAGRTRGCSVTLKQLGIENINEVSNNTIRKYLSNSHISFLGGDRDSKVDAIVTRCRSDLQSKNEYYYSRNAKDRKKPVSSSVFLYKGQYEDFKKLFFQRRREYFEELSVYLANWDTIRAEYENFLRALLELEDGETNKLYDSIAKKFPTKDEYEKSLRFSFIPMPVVVKITDKDLSEFENDLVESGIEQAIKPLLFSLFNVCEKVCFEMKDKEKIFEPTKKNFLKIAKRASENNFCHLPVFDIDIDKISLIDDELVITAEEIGINTYEYCKKIGLDNEIDKGCLAGCLE